MIFFLEPLPVRDLRAVIDEKTSMVEVSWSPENSSTQDSYKLQYHEVETTIGGDSNTLTTDKTKVNIFPTIMLIKNILQELPNDSLKSLLVLLFVLHISLTFLTR